MKRIFLPAALLLLAPLSAHAETAISRAAGPITLDGNLDDAGWKGATTIETFFEYQKTDNTPPPVKTVAWITYDEHYFYVGVRCDDPDPKRIRAPYVDRDHVFGDQDNLAVIIDARGEGKVGLQLRVNPRGIQGDAINNDTTGTEDYSPDFFYDTAARITSTGWNAEYRIPLTTLRYSKEKVQTWGVMILRNYPRDFRYTMSSSPLPRNSNCFICHAEKFTGLTDLPSSQHLIVAPYVTAQEMAKPEAGLGTPLGSNKFKSDAGADVKWSPTPNIAIDGTVNPDFSQIEADVAQISTNQRFALFYPEKRPFFLEGADTLQTPIQAVYTRTITAPRWGLRGTGKSGSTAWTMLVADDRGGGSLILPHALFSDFAPQNFKSLVAIARSRTEIGSNAIGTLFTARENDGGGYNRVIGPDFELRPNDKDQITGQFLYSKTENANRPDLSEELKGQSFSGHALRLNYNHSTKDNDWSATLQDFSDHFRADDGFIPQVGFREGTAAGGMNWFPATGFFVQHRGYAVADYYTDTDGKKILQDNYVGYFVRGGRNLAAFFELHAGDSARTAVGDLIKENSYLVYNIALNPSARFPNFAISGTIGDQVDFDNSREAHGWSANTSATFRPIDKVQAELTYNLQQLDVTGGRLFSAQVDRLKVTYSFTNKALLRVIGQYLDVNRNPGLYTFDVPRHSGTFLASILYSYKLNWQTVLFAGYGDDRVLDARANLLRSDRTLFLKVSYAFQR